MFKILLSLVQSSIRIETVAKKSRESQDSEGHNGRIKNDHQEQRCVIGDQGKNHPHPRILYYCVQMQKLDSKEG